MKQNIPTDCYGWCENDGKCGVQSKKCSCPDPGTQENPECNKGNKFTFIFTPSQVRARKKMQETKSNINIIDKIDDNTFIIGVIFNAVEQGLLWRLNSICVPLKNYSHISIQTYLNIKT